jgi:hypothetical protein
MGVTFISRTSAISDTPGTLIGLTMGLGMYAFFWFLPSLVLAIVAVATRPSPSVSWPATSKIATGLVSALALFISFGPLMMDSGSHSSSTASETASTGTSTSAGSPEHQTWHVDSGTSKMDGSSTVTLSLDAENKITGPFDTSRATLIIRCQERKTDLYVVTGMSASVEYGEYETHSARLRFDDSPPQAQHWSESTDNKALFAPNPISLAKRLASAKVFRFEFTPFDANPAISEFRVEGLSDLLPRLAVTCGWPIGTPRSAPGD